MILYNGRIYTANPQQPLVSALHIHDGYIVATGDDHSILTETNNDERIDLKGKTVLPGLVDSHIHLVYYSRFLQQVDCETDSRQECTQRVAERARNLKPGKWLLGHGWNHNTWEEGYGSKTDLDRACPENPVFLTHKALHSAWVNTIALRICNITAETPDPKGGKILRDSSGEPTGILLESAVRLVEKYIPPPTVDEIAEMILNAQSKLWQYGITGVHDFDGVECFAALQILEDREQLRLRILKGLPFETIDHAIALGLRTGFGSSYLQIGAVKLFADGALGAQTAAMLEPYKGSANNMGMLLLDSEQIISIGKKAVANGLSLAIHAIGDRSNREVLNALREIRDFEKANQIPPMRHRIEHVQCLSPQDIDRPAVYNVIASMQPLHATSDMDIAEQHWGARCQHAYAWNTLLARGTRLIFGSDAPVELPNPFLGIHAAVTRRRPDGTPGSEGWYPDQRISLHQALLSYTHAPAYAANRENHLGQLQSGYLADLILLEADPFLIPAQELVNVKPCATMVGGKWVWQT
ncbi:MAG: amidohydrolase [Anaerolineae bacterium]|nr:amidohydrolase [Anaerolineae bacterium]